MILSTSGSDPAARAWRRWLVMFCGAFFGVGGLFYVLLLLIDPYDTGRFPSFGLAGIADRSSRTADISRGRDPRFNAAIVGNSTGQLLDPYRLSEAMGLKFTQLAIPQLGPREELAIMRWVVSHHATYGALIVVVDLSWCSSDPNLEVMYPFPFWLYGGDLEYLANVLKPKALDRAAWRIEVALGLIEPADPVGYTDYFHGKTITFTPAPPRPPDDEGAAEWPPKFPWIEQLRAVLAALPPDAAAVVLMPPVHYSMLPTPGSRQAALIDACKSALANAVAGRPHGGFLDLRVDDAAAHDTEHFLDRVHFRGPLVTRVEDRIIALLRSGNTQADRGPAALTRTP
jgi:hypothetical protein